MLPQDYNENTIAIRSSLENVRIYIGGELRTVYDTKNTRPFGKNSASGYVFCETSGEDAGQEVRIELQSFTEKYSGVVNTVYCGDKSDIWGYIFHCYFMVTLIACTMLFSGAPLMQGLLCLWLFLEMIVNWNAMSYLTAIKDYQGIMWSFVAAVVVAFLSACAMMALGLPQVESLLAAVAFGYGVMMVWDVVLLHRYFPQSSESPWTFLAWLDRFLPLALTGLLTTLGLFSHLVITWCGPLGVHVK